MVKCFLCLWLGRKTYEWLYMNDDWLSKCMKAPVDWLTDYSLHLNGNGKVSVRLLLWREVFTRFEVVNWFDFGHFCTCLPAKLSSLRKWQKFQTKRPICMCIYSKFVGCVVCAGVIDGGRGQRGPIQPISYAQLSPVWTADVCNASWISRLLFTSIFLRLFLADNLPLPLPRLPLSLLLFADTLTFDMPVEVLSTS